MIIPKTLVAAELTVPMVGRHLVSAMLVHLKQGSVRVKPGDRVKQGDVIAAVGVSGSAEEPHLHYELRTGPRLNVDGLPSYFTRFCRLLGSRTIAVNRGRIDTGDIVITQPPH